MSNIAGEQAARVLSSPKTVQEVLVPQWKWGEGRERERTNVASHGCEKICMATGKSHKAKPSAV